jgi:mono/diheme cytochrome c family protein
VGAKLWRLILAGLALILLAPAGCQQKMARQPSYRPLAPSDFFPDGRAARPLPVGTVARRDLLLDDPQLESGLIPDGSEASRLSALLAPQQALALGPLTAAVAEAIVTARYYKTFPFPIGEKELERGRERFNIYCAVCHDRQGTGNGIIVQRGFPKPPDFRTDQSRGLKFQGARVLLRDAPVGYLFEVPTRGFGAMPSYASQVPPRDRWLIVAYVRALQPVRLDDLTDEERKNLEAQAVPPAGEGQQ